MYRSDEPQGLSRLVRPFFVNKFHYVYILQSINNPHWIYVGYTDNLIKRFKEHNVGKSKSTTHFKPFTVIHYEAYRNMKDAKGRELYLKTTKGKTTLKTMLRGYFKGYRNNQL